MKKSILLCLIIILFASCEQISNNTTEEGVLHGLFSVSETEQVRFSQGNLQYQASTATWRFADNQYDIIGAENSNISDSYDGWIDLFGWATSGYESSFPYQTSDKIADYGPDDESIAQTNYDWGIFNKILNGGNESGLWRLLTKDSTYIL